MLASERLLCSAGRSAAVAAILCLPADLDAANLSKVATRGKIILQEKCGRCHAIEAVGESPLTPPMRDIYARFNPRELQAELSEGMVSKHKEMPQIEFSAPPETDLDRSRRARTD